MPADSITVYIDGTPRHPFSYISMPVYATAYWGPWPRPDPPLYYDLLLTSTAGTDTYYPKVQRYFRRDGRLAFRLIK